MHVVLASAPHRDTFGYSMPPPGLLRLGAALRAAGVSVALDDLAFRLARGELAATDDLAERAAERLLAAEPAVLGLSTMGATVPIALAILAAVRARAPRVRTVLGGPGAHGIDAALVERFAAVDAVVRGEGEETFPALLARWAAGGDAAGVAGVTWRAADGAARREADRPPLADLDALGPTDWSLLPPLAEYKAITGEVEGLAPIDSGRGCVYDCTFCTIGRFWSRRSRTLSPAATVRELEALTAIEGARSAYLCHDIFGADRRHALELCARLEERALGLPWECRARADHLDRELLAAMARAGCWRVLLGVESGDALVREACNKAMRPDVDLLRVVDDCAAVGIVPILSLILGLPGETEAALVRTLELAAAASLRAGVNLSLHLPNPQPGCALGEELGAASRPVAGIPPDMAWGAGETAPERALLAAHPDLFTTWALLPGPEARLFELHALAEALPELLMRYPLTFALLARTGGERRDALALFRAWRATGRSFEAFAAAHRDPLADDALRLEQARVRAGARGAAQPPDAVVDDVTAVDDLAARVGGAPRAEAASDAELHDDAVPVAAGEVLELAHDVVELGERLLAAPDAPLPDPAALRRPTRLAVTSAGRRVATSRVGAGVERVLAELDGRTAAELDRTVPGLAALVRQLAAAGLVHAREPRPADAAEPRTSSRARGAALDVEASR